MTRDELLALLRAWGWSQTGWANRGALSVWKKGRHTVHTVRVPMRDAEDTAELLAGAVYDLATAEAPRLLAVMREVAALHKRVPGRDSHGHPYAVCTSCRNAGGEPLDYPCPTATALAPLTKEETNGR